MSVDFVRAEAAASQLGLDHCHRLRLHRLAEDGDPVEQIVCRRCADVSKQTLRGCLHSGILDIKQ
jgi:hypothetical protein